MDDRETLLTYLRKRHKNILVVTDQPPEVYADGTFDVVFVTQGDPLRWVEKVRAGGTLAGDCRVPDGLEVKEQGEVWVKCL